MNNIDLYMRNRNTNKIQARKKLIEDSYTGEHPFACPPDKHFEYKGMDCYICRNHAEVWLCYVRVPKNENFHYGMDVHDIECHWGCTFYHKIDNYVYFGMDFAHFDDYVPLLPSSGDKVWTLEQVTEETKRLADNFVIEQEETCSK